MNNVDETCLNDFKAGYANVFIQHVMGEFDWDYEFATEVTRDALRFMALCASSESVIMVSSPIVDQVVDTIMLDSPLLIWLEKNIFGARIVHVPAYAHGIVDPVINNFRYDLTVAIMQAAGYELDRQVIWPARLPVGYQTCGNTNDLDDCYMHALREVA